MKRVSLNVLLVTAVACAAFIPDAILAQTRGVDGWVKSVDSLAGGDNVEDLMSISGTELVTDSSHLASATGYADPVVQQGEQDPGDVEADTGRRIEPEADSQFPDRLDGTSSAAGDLEAMEEPKEGLFDLLVEMSAWKAFKQKLRNEFGISIGLSLGFLWQHYSESLVDERNAVGGKFALNATWELLNRGRSNALFFDVAVEDRRPIGTELPPLFGGIAAGSIVPTDPTWGDFNLGFTQWYLRQNLFNNRFQWALGKLFAPTYIDAYPFFDDNRQFLNQTFSTSPTIAAPLRGFGAVAAVYPVSNFYIQSGLYTTRSSNTGATIKDFFTVDEHFYHVEIGYSGLARSETPIQARGPFDANNFSVTGWYRDPLEDGSPKAHGIAVNANYLVAPNLMPFLRFGWSEGYLIDKSVTGGFGWRPPVKRNDLFGFGVGWADPASPLLDDQITFEAFYRIQVTEGFAVTPDLQVVLDPALNSSEDQLSVFSLRCRWTF